MQSTQPSFDAPLASTLFPDIVRLTASAAAPPAAADSGTAQNDVSRTIKLDLSKQAAQLHSNLAALSTQAAALPAGNLSLEDQDWLIAQLEKEVERKRQELAKMAQLTTAAQNGAAPAEPHAQPMDTA
ncbi:hypothetical protein Rhopal_000897-T1 [Rhodotorula paludigena]|uniref:Mediator of RNA polymerase II transcription subunit 9 n=1 Tax=Rhodotorula paludigena TaxID=86838 RepID=A0AAV5GF11_9BASI|nr:hypothetical protein Rhopal_000897-T1 [Rhodotorula paludigena]